MLEKEKFNGKVLIFPLLEIDFLKKSINLKEADVLVVTSVYALEKIKMELQNFQTPIFAVGQRCDKLLKELDKTIKIDFLNNSKELFFDSDKEQLSRVFFNLIKNSIESIQQKTEKVTNFNKNITIELNDIGSHISLTINDNGVGFINLNKNIREILNPYFTTKKQGTGLGLSIVNKIINDHNGNIELISKNDGAIIKIIFKR